MIVKALLYNIGCHSEGYITIRSGQSPSVASTFFTTSLGLKTNITAVLLQTYVLIMGHYIGECVRCSIAINRTYSYTWSSLEKSRKLKHSLQSFSTLKLVVI